MKALEFAWSALVILPLILSYQFYMRNDMLILAKDQSHIDKLKGQVSDECYMKS